MQGLLADVNCEGHLQLLVQLMRGEARREFWDHVNVAVLSFADLEMPETTTDDAVWRRCQGESLLLLTGNRNADGPDSLEATLRALNTLESLPIVTVADPQRLLRDRDYAEAAADRLLEYIFDIEQYYGSGRIYIP